MNAPRCFALMIVAVLAAATPAPAQQGPRQYYDSQWTRNGSYYYVRYFFKPNPASRFYQMHYVVWYPTHSTRYFYFNPERNRYWCRALANSNEEERWDVLDMAERRGTITEISDLTWSSATKMRPPIPGSTDGTKMAFPPLPPAVR